MRRSPWAIGSSAANRLPTLHTCHPTHSAFQCSTAVKIQPHPVVQREDPHAVGAPHHVRRLRDDRPGMHPRGALAAAVRGEQLVRPHHPQHPRPRDPDPVQDPQPRVDLPMALALERRAVEIGLNRLQQRRVPTPWASDPAARAPRPCACCCSRVCKGVERRARALPRLTHALDPVGAPRGLGERGAHRRDRRIAQGRRCSAARARSRSSSFSIDSSPMCRVAASSASATRSPWRACKPRSRPATARSRQSLQPVDLDAHFPRQRRQ